MESSNVSPSFVLQARLLQAALPMGIVLFAAVTVVLYVQARAHAPGPGPESVQLARTLSLANAGVFAVVWILVARFGDAVAAWGATRARVQVGQRDEWAARWLAGRLTLLALPEASGLLGLVACLTAIQSGVMYVSPFYWANMVSAAAMVAYALATLPTAASIARAAPRG
ncbi:MAG TPA: hypothetical protein VMH39_00205 [Gemmatimonadaceae bacterium]|nr:hypothetical protein [Gemmatimonadaceae bacterium]